MTFRVLVPMEPVEPRIAIVFMGFRRELGVEKRKLRLAFIVEKRKLCLALF